MHNLQNTTKQQFKVFISYSENKREKATKCLLLVIFKERLILVKNHLLG